VFYISAGIYAFGTLFYGLFGSGQMQSWAIQHDSPALQGLEIEVNTGPREHSAKKSHTWKPRKHKSEVGHNLSVQSNQVCAAQEAECAV